MSKLTTYLCEKPSQAASVARFLGLSNTHRRKNHFIDDKRGIAVCHAVGHLFELQPPEKFDPSLAKSWAIASLPVLPDKHDIELKSGTEALFNTIKSLFGKSHTVIIATDADNEGELIARDIIAKSGYNGTVQRVLYDSTDDKTLRKAFKNPQDEKITRFMAQEADLRRRVDWAIGMNLTMACTTVLKSKKAISKGAFSVGRVITPIGLIVHSIEQHIKNFKPKKYFNVDAVCSTPAGNKFTARLRLPEKFLDEDGYCTSNKAASQFAKAMKGQKLPVSEVIETKKTQSAPLPFDLSSLQIAVDRFGLDADETLELLQTLYDKPNSAVTYPRTDCRYLPDGMFDDVGATIKHLNGLREIKRLHFNIEQKPKSFDDSKVAIHHGIVPTTKAVALNRLTEKQLIVYLTIALRFVQQFMKKYEYIDQKVVISNGKISLVAKAKKVVEKGWKAAEFTEPKEDVPILSVNKGDEIEIVSSSVVEGETKPPSRLSTAKLVEAMESPAKYVDDPELKRLVENSKGIGTPATRSDSIKRALKKHIIRKKGKVVVPDRVFEQNAAKLEKMNPGFSALMQQQFSAVIAGKASEKEFLRNNQIFIERMIEEWTK